MAKFISQKFGKIKKKKESEKERFSRMHTEDNSRRNLRNSLL